MRAGRFLLTSYVADLSCLLDEVEVLNAGQLHVWGLGGTRGPGTGDREVLVVASVLLLPVGLPFRGGCVQKRGGVFMPR